MQRDTMIALELRSEFRKERRLPFSICSGMAALQQRATPKKPLRLAELQVI
jgi:hypothetical protein